MERIDELLATLAGRADCRRRKVGAVVVAQGRIVGRGWNGLPDGSCLAGECPRGRLSYEEQPAFTDYAATGCTALHAEVSALREAVGQTAGATLYVTCEPCPDCAEAIRRAGIQTVRVVQLDSIAPTSPGR